MTDETPARKPGAPLGNQNALKHGFYSRKFTPRQTQDLVTGPETQTYDEVALLRVLIRDLIESAGPDLDYQQRAELLHAVTLAVHSLNALVRTQHVIDSVSLHRAKTDLQEYNTLPVDYSGIDPNLGPVV